jgi:hypothetical protein
MLNTMIYTIVGTLAIYFFLAIVSRAINSCLTALVKPRKFWRNALHKLLPPEEQPSDPEDVIDAKIAYYDRCAARLCRVQVYLERLAALPFIALMFEPAVITLLIGHDVWWVGPVIGWMVIWWLWLGWFTYRLWLKLAKD